MVSRYSHDHHVTECQTHNKHHEVGAVLCMEHMWMGHAPFKLPRPHTVFSCSMLYSWSTYHVDGTPPLQIATPTHCMNVQRSTVPVSCFNAVQWNLQIKDTSEPAILPFVALFSNELLLQESQSVLCWEVVPFLEGPLSEVPLHWS